ncbi:hypothetical protein SERLA73DRAFT_156505 [Serpula lacrymans var. lacrymans S7.3]|uniref:Helicase C-terminal domain-containing protein n=1 Tax=Serpula lacrymans var. lacrymans (strain S7.3) TaxID=936435 RepID=F8QES1_SERL3|nr:hypothetical protein SERLA73DRAFT_156505 [Serpula lacrymans var. lacrymans S7.3]
MVSPLLALHDEQVQTFQNEFKLDTVAVNSSHGGCRQEILDGGVTEQRVWKESDVGEKLEFNQQNFVNIDIENNRENVSLVVREIQNPLKTYTDLNFIILTGIMQLQDTKKTFVYADNIAVGTEIIDHLIECLPTEHRHSGIIWLHNAAQGKAYQKEVIEMFCRGKVQILVCTDAAGMGCNIPYIDMVVQWKLTALLSMFVQRAGLKKNVEEEQTSVKGKQKKKTGKVHAQSQGSKQGAHGDLHDFILVKDEPVLDYATKDEGLLAFIQTGLCRRAVLTKVYGNKTNVVTVPCCNICDVSLLNEIRPGIISMQKRQSAAKKGEICEFVCENLQLWQKSVHKRDFTRAMFASLAILQDDTINFLAMVGPIKSAEELHMLVGGQ